MAVPAGVCGMCPRRCPHVTPGSSCPLAAASPWGALRAGSDGAVSLSAGMGKGQHRMPSKDELVQRYNRMNTIPQVTRRGMWWWGSGTGGTVLGRSQGPEQDGGVTPCALPADPLHPVPLPPEPQPELHRALRRCGAARGGRGRAAPTSLAGHCGGHGVRSATSRCPFATRPPPDSHFLPSAVITSKDLQKHGNIWVCPVSDHVCTRFFFV